MSIGDKKMWNIGKYGVPKEYTACPACGRQYGHHRTKVCMNCEECSKCCQCNNQKLELAKVAIQKILSEDA